MKMKMKINYNLFRMRRWSGRVRDTNIILSLQCYDDTNHRLSRTLASATDTVCEAIATIVMDSVIPTPETFFWMTDTTGINNFNAAVTGANTPASIFFIQHRLRTESLFTYSCSGRGLDRHHDRYYFYINHIPFFHVFNIHISFKHLSFNCISKCYFSELVTLNWKSTLSNCKTLSKIKMQHVTILFPL